MNFLFGFDYIYWKNSADHGVARVHKNKDGVVWYWRYKITSLIDKIENEDDVIWLTCSKYKYFIPKLNCKIMEDKK